MSYSIQWLAHQTVHSFNSSPSNVLIQTSFHAYPCLSRWCLAWSTLVFRQASSEVPAYIAVLESFHSYVARYQTNVTPMQIQRNVALPVFHISRVFSARADALNVAYLRSLSSLHKQEILYYMKHQSLSVVYTVRSLKSVILLL